MNAKSKENFNRINKAKKIRKGQRAIVRPGKGINPLEFVNPDASLIRVTAEGIIEYN